MQLTIGQKVAYPNQGVCLVEEVKKRIVGERSLIGYILRVLGDNSTIFVPTDNAESVGIRPLITSHQCRKLATALGADFEAADCDWKQRSREFNEKLHSGDIFEAADVFKKLTLLSFEKRLSFREQTMLDKARFLVVSELSNASKKGHISCEREVCRLVDSACQKHRDTHPTAISAAIH